MTQYFKAVNPDREETLTLPGLSGAVETLTNADSMLLLSFLLTDTDLDDYDYYGRWAGDTVKLVGDYDESELYDADDPTLTVAPLADPPAITYDPSSTTATDPDDITVPWTISLRATKMPVVEGSWTKTDCDATIPDEDHPEAELQVGSYVKLSKADSDRLSGRTVGVVTDIEAGWPNITERVQDEAKRLAAIGGIDQETAHLPKQVLR